MRGKYCLPVLLALIIGLAACGPEAPTEDPEKPTPEPTATPEPTPTPEPGNPVNLTGTWANKIANSQIFNTDAAGEGTVVITSISRVTVTHDPATHAFSSSVEICDVALSEYNGNQTTWPPEAIAAIEIQTTTGTLSDSETGAAFSSTIVQTLGWNPDGNAATEALPLDGNDPRVFDADADGEVGVTLNIDAAINGDIYIANRTSVNLTGLVFTEDKLAGDSNNTLEQNVLGASSGFLEVELTATQDPTPGASPFVMVRIGDAQNCTDILAAGDGLFQ